MKLSFLFSLSLLLISIQTNAQENWNVVNSGTTDNLTDVCFIENQFGWIIGYSGILLRTSNAGNTWNNNTIPYENLKAIQFVNQNVGWIVGDNGLIIKTTDAGNNWFEQQGGQILYLEDLYFFDDQVGLICGGGSSTGQGKILRTINGGSQWDEIALSIYSPRLLSIYFLNSNLGWTAGTNDLLYRTIDGGVSWDSIAYFGGGWQNYHYGVYFIDSLNGNVCGWANFGTGNTSGPIYKTSDGGYSWTRVAAVGYGRFNSFAFHEASNSLYSVGSGGYPPYYGGKIYKSTDGGSNWNEVSSPTSERLNKITFTQNKGWIVGRNGTILTSLISSSVEEIVNPSEFNLMQNFPNPYNPTTTIKYQIPEVSFVIIKVYDVLGKEIATLVNEEKPAGSYEIEFSATGGGNELTSGIYFYQLRVGNFVETKKMVLLK